jgi:hypothetical protein
VTGGNGELCRGLLAGAGALIADFGSAVVILSTLQCRAALGMLQLLCHFISSSGPPPLLFGSCAECVATILHSIQVHPLWFQAVNGGVSGPANQRAAC